MPDGAPEGRGFQLIGKTANAFRLRDWTLTQIDPDGLRYVGHILVWMHWAFGIHGLVQAFYRPIDGYWAPQYLAYLFFIALLMAFNGYLHYLVLSNKVITWRWVLVFCALDVTLLSLAIVIDNGFSSYHFHLLYYPPLAFLAVVVTSFRITMALVTMVAAIYLALSLTVGDGLDFEARDEKVLLARIFVMYLVVALVNLISRFERARWSQAVRREQTLLRERTELSRTIHNTMAQSAYMIGVGIDRVKELADKSNRDLMSALEETSRLSKSAMWDLRHPIEIGEIFDGMEVGGVLESLVATFSSISSVPAEFVQSGDEPPLPTSTRGALFSIAHNALTNALRHSNADHVRVCLDFDDIAVRMSISDDGDGLPRDYMTRGQGFKNMREDAERVGGRLMVESDMTDGGTTVTCVAPYQPTGGS